MIGLPGGDSPIAKLFFIQLLKYYRFAIDIWCIILYYRYS